MTKKIIVRAPSLSASGYGHQARTILRALRQYPDRFDVHLMNVGWGQTGWIWNDNEERRWIDSIINKTNQFHQQTQGNPQYDISLQVISVSSTNTR